ncbi:MAG: 30S ribosomal protein S20 [Planctomycetes bacterium]|nr:30S ribosomal protein S20 [Planctomycetota bacterium]MCC7170440.1 30S ribosomal protein S20 [Planctomycetota bacterium]
MPHIKQAAKRHRQSQKRHLENTTRMSAMKSQIKKAMSALEAGDVAKAKTEIAAAMQKIDKAAKHRTIHPNTASRRKSSLSVKLRNLERAGAKK